MKRSSPHALYGLVAGIVLLTAALSGCDFLEGLYGTDQKGGTPRSWQPLTIGSKAFPCLARIWPDAQILRLIHLWITGEPILLALAQRVAQNKTRQLDSVAVLAKRRFDSI